MLEEYRGEQVNQKERLDESNIRSDILVTNRIVDMLDDVQGLKILELGSGNGKVARMLHARGAKIVGTDAITEQVRIAEENSSKDIRYIEADFTDTEFVTFIPEAPYDAVISVMSLFYATSEGVAQALENVRALLKPEGRFILGTASPYRGLKKEGFDYFKEQQAGVELPSRTSEPFKTTYIHMPLEKLVTLCLEHGFVLAKFIEPHATPEELAAYPDILTERELTVPDYLILEFKPK